MLSKEFKMNNKIDLSDLKELNLGPNWSDNNIKLAKKDKSNQFA